MAEITRKNKHRLYFDHAATSFPKPPGVTAAMVHYAEQIGASAGRGGYAEARASEQIITQCRARINTLINGQSPEHLIFTLNASDALNLAIRGLVLHHAEKSKRTQHVITTHLEHNSVLRPLNELQRLGLISQTRIPCDPDTGIVDPADIKNAIQPNTTLITVIQGSNVTGTLQPINEIGQLCHESEIPFVVDAAQSAGHLPIDVQALQIDALALPGHKGLLGPLGTGALYIKPGLEKQLATIREGGTGSVSELDTQPQFLPDRFEPGSHNAIGIAGLSEGVNYLLQQGVDKIRHHEMQLCRTLLEILENEAPETLRYYGPKKIAERCGVFSFRLEGLTPHELADQLENRFNILARPGLHCAPLAHQTIGTFAQNGTTRLSFGWSTTTAAVQNAAHALCTLAKEQLTNADNRHRREGRCATSLADRNTVGSK